MSLGVEKGIEPIVDIRVAGVGGAGGNVVNHMMAQGANGVDFIAVNTDRQALNASTANHKVQIGAGITSGQGAGSDPDIGGTGTGASPILASIARELGSLTVGVVTKPFSFEGRRRMDAAEAGIEELIDRVDSLVIIPNDRLKYVSERKITLSNAFEIADDVLRQAVQAISDIINNTGFINMDFADVTAVMKDAGLAHMGIGRAAGQQKAQEAAQRAISSPLLETTISGAKGILVNVTGSTNMGLEEVELATNLVQEAADPDALFIFGATFDERLEDEIVVTVIATGFEEAAGSNPPPQKRRDSKGPEPSPVKDDDPYQEIFRIFDRKR